MLAVQNLPNEIRSELLRANLIGRLPKENGADLRPALDECITTVVSSMTGMAGAVDQRTTLWQVARQHANAPATIGAPGNSSDPAKTLLADRYHGTVHALASTTSVATSTVAELLSAVAGTGLNLVGKQVVTQNWDAAALGQWLQPQRVASTAAPLGIPLGVPMMSESMGAAPRGSNRWLWIAGLLFTAMVSFLLGMQLAPKQTVRVLPDNLLASTERFALPTVTDARLTTYDAANPVTITVDDNFHGAGGYPVVNAGNTSPNSGGGYVYGNAGVPVVLKFEDGTQQIIGANSTESRLYQFLANPRVEVDTTNLLNNWINFDRIYFESSKDELSFESKWQLSNISRILKTFPDAKVRIGGYTDSSGSPELNLRLSQNRAESTRSTLISQGVNPDNIVATGYGVLDNIASNATPDGRALNRRVSIRVLEK